MNKRKWFVSGGAVFLVTLLLPLSRSVVYGGDALQAASHTIYLPLVTRAGSGGGCPGYPSGFSFISVPTPLADHNPTYPLINRPVPTVGECYTDLRFGTRQQRVTRTDGYNSRHEYARFDPFNADQSLILLVSMSGGFRVYRTTSIPYNQDSNLVMEVSLAEARWDPTDPNLLWGLQEFSIVQLNTLTQQISTIKDFSTDAVIGPLIAQGTTYRITMHDEGEASLDKRYWALALQGNDQVGYGDQYLFTWDRAADKVLGVYPLDTSVSIDWVGMSPLGNWVLIGGDSANPGVLAGLTMANKEFTQFHRLDYATAHADVGLDRSGNEVIIMQNVNTDMIDLIPIDLSTKPILTPNGDYTETNRTPLIRLYYNSGSPDNLNSGIHISCNTPGYCVISTYIAPGLAEQNWLDRSIVLVGLDRSQPSVYYLAKVYATTQDEPRAYWEETHASITRDGSRVVWAENWSQNVGQEELFLTQLTMPTNWRILAGGQ